MSRPLRIFLLENHEDTRAIFKIYFERLGHTVIEADSLARASEKLPGSKPDLVISDIGLPDGDGWDLLDRGILSKSVYAVAMSGYGMGADRERSKTAGFRHHLTKPVTPDTLDTILAEVEAQIAAA